LHNICGVTKIVCSASLHSDLSFYYNWNISDNILTKMVNDYTAYYNNLWEYIKQHKKHNLEDNHNFKTPLINNDSGIYFNVIKIDFQRAFTNYIKKVLNDNHLNIIKHFFKEVSTLFLPTSAKKFLYNYTLTNIIVNLLGKATLAELRYTVYQDVMYLASQLGEILKSEIDGAYIITPLKELPVFDVYGQLTLEKYRWLVWDNPIMIGTDYAFNKTVIKGLGKRSPNTLFKTLENIISSKTNKERDLHIENFFYTPSHILDWCYKKENGNEIELSLKTSDITIPSLTNEDILDIQDLFDSLNKDNYFKHIKNVLTTIYELLG